MKKNVLKTPQFSVLVQKSSIVILQFGFRIGFSSPNVTCWSPAELFKKVFPFYFVKNRSEPFRKVLSRWKMFNNLRHRKNKFEFHEFWNSHQHLERVKKKSSLCRRSEVALSGGSSFRFEFWIFSFFSTLKSGVVREWSGKSGAKGLTVSLNFSRFALVVNLSRQTIRIHTRLACTVFLSGSHLNWSQVNFP